MNKNEIIKSIAREANEARVFYKAGETAFLNSELRKLNFIEAAGRITTAVMYLNRLHNEFNDEFDNSYDFEKEIKEADELTYKHETRLREELAALDCIIKYGKNHFKDEDGYL